MSNLLRLKTPHLIHSLFISNAQKLSNIVESSYLYPLFHPCRRRNNDRGAVKQCEGSSFPDYTYHFYIILRLLTLER